MKQSRMALVSNSANSKSCSSDEENELRRGPWTLEEDNLLVNYISCHGEGRWNLLAKCAGLKRNGKSCRLRWLNYLKPDVKRGNLSSEEQLLIIELHSKLGNRWSKIAQYLPGRTDNEIKNYWRTRVQKQARQLKIDSDSKSFLDVVRRFWMPNMHHNMKQAASPLYSSYSTLPNTSIRPPLNNQVPLSSSPTPSTLSNANHGNGAFDPVIGASVPLSHMQNSNLSEILNDPPNPCAFGDNFCCNPFLDANYPVDSSSHDMEAYNLAPTSTMPIDDTSYLDYQMPEGDWASLDDVEDSRSIWNMNELWQFGRPE